MRKMLLVLLLLIGLIPAVSVAGDAALPTIAVAAVVVTAVIPAVRDGPKSVASPRGANDAQMHTHRSPHRLARTTGKHLDVLPVGPAYPNSDVLLL